MKKYMYVFDEEERLIILRALETEIENFGKNLEELTDSQTNVFDKIADVSAVVKTNDGYDDCDKYARIEGTLMNLTPTEVYTILSALRRFPNVEEFADAKTSIIVAANKAYMRMVSPNG